MIHDLHCECKGMYEHFAAETERARRDVGVLRAALERIAEGGNSIAREALAAPMSATYES